MPPDIEDLDSDDTARDLNKGKYNQENSMETEETKESSPSGVIQISPCSEGVVL